MATQRRIVREKPEDFAPVQGLKPGGDPGKSNIAPAVPASVVYKLLGFTFAMAALPIGSYYLTLNTIFGGNSTFAGATAAVVANIVLVGYIVVAMQEDRQDRIDAELSRKAQ